MAEVTGIPCMNCHRLVEQSEGKVFAEVFVCPDCYKMAEHTYVKCDGELKRLRILLRESIRIALVEGKLQFGQAAPVDEVPKADLLKMIVELTEKKNATAPRHTVR